MSVTHSSSETLAIPEVILAAGPSAVKAYREFFFARCANANTRRAYQWQLTKFFRWCASHRLTLTSIELEHVDAYMRQFSGANASKKQSVAAIRRCVTWLFQRKVLVENPVRDYVGPRHAVSGGKTPHLTGAQIRHLFASIDTSTVLGLRDRALIGVMYLACSRVGAVVQVRVKDFYAMGTHKVLVLHEKGSKDHVVVVDARLQRWLEAYVAAAQLESQPEAFMFRAATSRAKLKPSALLSGDVWRMVKRRARTAGLPVTTTCHSFRVAGLTGIIEAGGTLEMAQLHAGHSSSATTKLYIRTQQPVTLDVLAKLPA